MWGWGNITVRWSQPVLHREFTASLHYKVRPCLNTTKKKKHKKSCDMYMCYALVPHTEYNHHVLQICTMRIIYIVFIPFSLCMYSSHQYYHFQEADLEVYFRESLYQMWLEILWMLMHGSIQWKGRLINNTHYHVASSLLFTRSASMQLLALLRNQNDHAR